MKRLDLLTIFILVNLFLGVPATSNAQVAGQWPQKTRLSGVYAVFGGEKYKAITNESVGFGGEISILKGDWRFGNVVGKIRGLYITGTEDFLDGTTEVNSKYTIFATEPALGIHLNIVPFISPGFRTYLSGLGVMSYNHLRFDKSTELSTINKSDTAVGFGYEIGAGIEWNIKREVKTYLLFGEIQYRNVTADLAGQSQFQLTGMQMVGGFGW